MRDWTGLKLQSMTGSTLKILGELYQYGQGMFESYAVITPQPGLKPTSPINFYTHHKLKVLAADAELAQVTVTDTDTCIHLGKCLAPCEL